MVDPWLQEWRKARKKGCSVEQPFFVPENSPLVHW